MKLSPCLAQGGNLAGQSVPDAAQLRPAESVTLPQLRRPVRAVQDEHRLAARSDDVDMRGSVVGRKAQANRRGNVTGAGANPSLQTKPNLL
jgi:hypothetical protein